MRGLCSRRAFVAGVLALPFVGEAAVAAPVAPESPSIWIEWDTTTASWRHTEWPEAQWWEVTAGPGAGQASRVHTFEPARDFQDPLDPYAYQNWLERESRKTDPEPWRAIDATLAEIYADEFD